MSKDTSVSKHEYTLPNDILALWEFTVREMRGEIKAVVPNKKSKWLLATCDKLEQSMCAIAGGKYALCYTLYADDEKE